MTFPHYLHFGPLSLHPHWVFESLAYFVGFRLYLWQRRSVGDHLDRTTRWWTIVAGIVGAALGSKLLYWLSDAALTVHHALDPAFLIGGKSIVGGLVGGLIAVEWAKRRLGVTRATGDLYAIPLCLGIAIGRIGCFLTGLNDHTHGLPAALPWAVDFGDGIPRHPAQLYEMVFLLLLAALLGALARRPHREGDAFKLFMVGYLLFRLWLESIKPAVSLAGLNAVQWVSLSGLLYYGAHFARRLRSRPKPRPRSHPAPGVAPDGQPRPSLPVL